MCPRQVRTMLLDEILSNPDTPDKDAATLDFETRALKDLREVITHKGLDVSSPWVRSYAGAPSPRVLLVAHLA